MLCDDDNDDDEEEGDGDNYDAEKHLHEGEQEKTEEMVFTWTELFEYSFFIVLINIVVYQVGS